MLAWTRFRSKVGLQCLDGTVDETGAKTHHLLSAFKKCKIELPRVRLLLLLMVINKRVLGETPSSFPALTLPLDFLKCVIRLPRVQLLLIM